MRRREEPQPSASRVCLPLEALEAQGTGVEGCKAAPECCLGAQVMARWKDCLYLLCFTYIVFVYIILIYICLFLSVHCFLSFLLFSHPRPFLPSSSPALRPPRSLPNTTSRLLLSPLYIHFYSSFVRLSLLSFSLLLSLSLLFTLPHFFTFPSTTSLIFVPSLTPPTFISVYSPYSHLYSSSSLYLPLVPYASNLFLSLFSILFIPIFIPLPSTSLSPPSSEFSLFPSLIHFPLTLLLAPPFTVFSSLPPLIFLFSPLTA